MAHKKAGGTAKNLRDSNPKFLGIKLGNGALAKAGAIIVRQRGIKMGPGENVRMGRDHTLFAVTEGRVKFTTSRKVGFDGTKRQIKIVNVL